MKDYSKLSPQAKQTRIRNCGEQAARRFAAKLLKRSTIGMSMREVGEILSKYFKIDIPKTPKLFREVYAKMYMQGVFGEVKPDLKNLEIVAAVSVKALTPKHVPHPFYDSDKWLRTKRKILLMYGTRCMKCSAIGIEMHVDHIQPRSKNPSLELTPSNLQVLCKSCNLNKSNLHTIDYRPDWAKTHDWSTF